MGASEHEHRLVEGKMFLGLINQSHFAVQKIWSDEKKFNLDGPDGYRYYWRDLRKEKRQCGTENSDFLIFSRLIPR